MNDQERLEAHRAHRMDDTVTVLEGLKTRLPKVWELYSEVVGRWVWVCFQEPPASETRQELSAMGFCWNAKRRVWQHCGGKPATHSPGDPRWKYGAAKAAELDLERVAS